MKFSEKKQNTGDNLHKVYQKIFRNQLLEDIENYRVID